MVVGMDTELKTIIYRDGKKVDDVSKKKKSFVSILGNLNGRRVGILCAAIVLAVVTMVILLTGGAVEGVTEAEGDSAIKEAAALNVSEDVCEVQEKNEEETLLKGETESRVLDNAEGLKVDPRLAGIAHNDEMREYIEAEIEKDQSIVLLGETTVIDEYIPVMAGYEDDGEEDIPTKRAEIEEKMSEIPNPTEVPSKLTYVYNPDMCLELDEDNLTVLRTIVEAEAGDQDVYGRMLVANVIINRIHAGFADTVRGVVFQRINGSVQFSPTKQGGSYFKVKVSDTTKEAVDRVLSGEDYSEGALYFFQRSLTATNKAKWFDSSLKFLFKYGCHEFFKEKNK